MRFRLTVDDSDYKGNITNLYNGQKIDGSSGLTATGKLEWTPTDNLSVHPVAALQPQRVDLLRQVRSLR